MTESLLARDRRTLFLIIFSIFGTAWILIKEPVEFYIGYIVLLALLPGYLFRFGIPSRFWAIFFYFVLVGMLNVALGNDTIEQFLKIFIGMMISYLFYFIIFERFSFDVKLLFKAYLIGSYIVSVIGLIQLVSFLVHFTPGYDFRWLGVFNKWSVINGGNLGIRINSIFGEPSTFAAVIAPAMFVSLHNVIRPRYRYYYKLHQSILVLVIYLSTFSSIGYLGIFVAIILLMINLGFARFILMFIPLLIVAFIYLYNNVPDFRYRWDSTFFLFQTGVIDINTEHGSSIVFYNNYVVAMKNFSTNFLTGTGLGSHPVAFEQYSVTKNIEVYGFANNSADANSMLLRIISELGLVGLVGAFIFLKRGYVRRTPTDNNQQFWIISAACMCMFVLYLLRQGHYFLNGFPFFVWMYYYSRKNADHYELNRSAVAETLEVSDVNSSPHVR